MKTPEQIIARGNQITTLDSEGYPTPEFLKFIREYTNETMPIMEFVELLRHGWYHGEPYFTLHRKYKGKHKLELHTGGWSGNEETIREILGNIHLTHFRMQYVYWERGGHYYFEVKP